jgi:hypothetical protein
MRPFLPLPLIIILALISNTILADNLENNVTSKEVYSFNSKDGTPVFTDMKPKKHQFDTQTIKTAKPNDEEIVIIDKATPSATNNTEITHNTTTIIHQYGARSNSKTKRKDNKRRCKYFKHKLEYVNRKMKAGYRPSEYKRLEKERMKYRSLVFERCDSRVD